MVPVSPFRFHRRIDLRLGIEVDAMVKVKGAVPFVEPERKIGLDFLLNRSGVHDASSFSLLAPPQYGRLPSIRFSSGLTT